VELVGTEPRKTIEDANSDALGNTPARVKIVEVMNEWAT